MNVRHPPLIVLLACGACLLPARERAELDKDVGRASNYGVSVNVKQGLASIREFDGTHLTLWAQAPELTLDVDFDEPGIHSLKLDVLNCMPGAVLRVEKRVLASTPVLGRKAHCRFSTTLAKSSTLELGPPDAAIDTGYVFGVLSDIQRGVGEVREVFERMNEDRELRFIVSTGDLANIGTRAELVRIQDELETLNVPFFSTVGNHEMGASSQIWHELFGLFNPHFVFKGVTFSLVDSANATIDPQVYDWLEDWLEGAKRDAHIVLTHVPPIDPVGLRGGGFRSRKEGAKLLTRLAKGRVDALFLGHIHSYYAFSSAGVPTFLSGGGGAIQEQLDGIGRHYLRVRVKKGTGIDDVAVVRVD